MSEHNTLKTEDKWFLTILNLFPYIEGKTRLQKFGMLSFYEVLKDEEFFDDWIPNKYGGFSPRLANSLERLKEHGYIRSDTITSGRDRRVDRYSLTESGKHVIRGFKTGSPRLEKIKSILSHYLPLSQSMLLADVYEKYPWLTVNSKIIANINKTADLDPYSEHESSAEFQEKATHTPTSSSQHVFGDEEFREKLAKFVGLEKVPDLDPESFNRIQGIWAEHIDTEYFDAEEAIREVRGC